MKKEKRRLIKYLTVGGGIGTILGFILFIIAMFLDIWDVINIFEKIVFFPFLLGEGIFRFGLSKCSGMGCIVYFFMVGIVGYILLGIVVGFIVYKIKVRKNKK